MQHYQLDKETCLTSRLERLILSAYGHADLLDDTASDTEGDSNTRGQNTMDLESIPLALVFMFLILNKMDLRNKQEPA